MLDLTTHYETLARAIPKWVSKDPEAEDCAQDVWLRLVETAHQYDANRGSVLQWARRVARSVLINRHEKRTTGKRTMRADPTRSQHQPAFQLQSQLVSKFREALAQQVAQESAQVCVMLEMGFSRDEIVEQLDTTLYKVNKHRAHMRDLALNELQMSERPSSSSLA